MTILGYRHEESNLSKFHRCPFSHLLVREPCNGTIAFSGHAVVEGSRSCDLMAADP
jgi:hypothetical protein